MGVLGFIGALIGARATWRANHPDRQLSFRLGRARPLLAAAVPTGVLDIQYNGVQLTNAPFLVDFTLKNRGRQDIEIPTGQFLDFKLENRHPILGVIHEQVHHGRRSVAPIPTTVTADGELRLLSGWIPSGAVYKATFIAKGTPMPATRSHILPSRRVSYVEQLPPDEVLCLTPLPNVALRNRWSGAKWRIRIKVTMALAAMITLIFLGELAQNASG